MKGVSSQKKAARKDKETKAKRGNISNQKGSDP
jgi:hypothetical protein